MKKSNDKEKQKKIARERVDILLQKAEEVFPKNTSRADRYVEIARAIAMKTNLQLSKIQKKKFCKHCYAFHQPGVNATTRIRNRKVITYCKLCKKYTRIPLTKRIKA